jgi:hypothetical protein
MSTDYYIKRNHCKSCGRFDHDIIGTSSAGWCFGLRVDPEKGINDLEDWITIFEDRDCTIEDEYGKIITTKEMISIITERKSNTDFNKPPASGGSWLNFMRDNQAEHGPNGLIRPKIGDRCIKHGEGTWYCFIE